MIKKVNTKGGIKILWKHPRLRDYRIPLFDCMIKHYDIDFIFEKNSRFDDREAWSNNHRQLKIEKNKYFTSLFRVILSRKYNVLIISNPLKFENFLCIVLFKAKKGKVIVWTEDWIQNEKDIIGFLKTKVISIALWLADGVYATGTRTKKFCEQVGINKKKIYSTIQCSHDYSRISQKKPDDLKSITGDTFVYLYLSRIVRLKGLDLLIKSFAKLSQKHGDTYLLIIGDGDFKKYCEQVAEDQNIKNYYFGGEVYLKEHKSYLYQISNVLVLPSRIVNRGREGWGLVVNEALSMSKPVIVTDAVGSSDDLVLDGTNGYVVKHSSEESLFAAMKKIYNDKEKYQLMAKSSRKIFDEKNNYEDMAIALMMAIRRIVLNGVEQLHG